MEFESNLLFGGGISVDISVVSISVVAVVDSKKKKKKQRHTDKPIKIDRTSHGQKIK